MSRTRNSESGFTLAGLIVILTVMMIFIAYTVPKAWSIAINRDRDEQTIFAMKQYARAMRAFQLKNNAQPVSLDQLKQAKSPRLIRGKGELIDPLTGKVDWIPIPMTNQTAQQAQNQAAAPGGPLIGVGGGARRGVGAGPDVPQTGLPAPAQQAGQPGGFVGPIIGVRPAKTGASYLSVNGFDSYEQWSYTTVDLDNEIKQRWNSVMVK
jgi:type II secretory pathway pseudopilin PulG